MLEWSCYVMTDTSSIQGGWGRGCSGKQQLWRLLYFLWYITATAVPFPPRHHDQKTLGTFSSIWPRRALGKEIARILCPTHNVWDTWPSARKSEAIWVSHFNHQPLLSCLPPPLLAKVQICQASFIPKYFLYSWRIAKICGLLPALWVSTLSHGCLFSLNIIQKHRHEQKQVCSSLPWKPAWEVNNRREYRSPWA